MLPRARRRRSPPAPDRRPWRRRRPGPASSGHPLKERSCGAARPRGPDRCRRSDRRGAGASADGTAGTRRARESTPCASPAACRGATWRSFASERPSRRLSIATAAVRPVRGVLAGTPPTKPGAAIVRSRVRAVRARTSATIRRSVARRHPRVRYAPVERRLRAGRVAPPGRPNEDPRPRPRARAARG